MRPVYKDAIKQYGDNYDVLRTYLFSSLDAYCSYCEAPISNDSAVEHKVPKAKDDGMPTYAFQWRNLLISCQSCNSAKGAKPAYDATNQSQDDPTNQDYLDALAQWVWPDGTANMPLGAQFPEQPSPPVDDIDRLLEFDYSSKSQVDLSTGGLVRLPPAEINAPWATTAQTMLWIMPSAAAKADASLLTRVKNTIQGLNLNYFNSADPRYNDRRVVNRTAAMALAQDSLQDLWDVFKRYQTNPDAVDLGDPRIFLMVRAIRQSIIATGFWSVWFWVFRKALDHPPNPGWGDYKRIVRKNLLEWLLVYYRTPEERANTTEIFAGTDVDRLHLDAFQ